MKASGRSRESRASGTVLVMFAILSLPTTVDAQPELDGTRVVSATPRVPPADYASDGRRDPFVPLTGTYAAEEDGEPRIEQLELTGIFLGESGNSLVVLEDPTRRGHFVRVGESLGNARLLAIQPDAAIFEVDDYGILRRDTLRLVPDRSLAAPPPNPAPAGTAPGHPEPEEGT